MFAEAWRTLEERSLAYYKHGGGVRLTESGCLGCCSYGPTLAAYYGDERGALAQAWYVGIDAPSLVRIAEALDAGRPPPDDDKRFDPR